MIMIIIIITPSTGRINLDKVLVLAQANSRPGCDWWPINWSARHTQRAI